MGATTHDERNARNFLHLKRKPKSQDGIFESILNDFYARLKKGRVQKIGMNRFIVQTGVRLYNKSFSYEDIDQLREDICKYLHEQSFTNVQVLESPTDWAFFVWYSYNTIDVTFGLPEN